MPTNPIPQQPEASRDGGHAHATDADLTGPRRDSEKDADTPQPGEGSKPQQGDADEAPVAELGHS